jgi:hypothetical protein
MGGVPSYDDAYRAATHLKTGFGGVRFWGLDLRIALSASLASCLSYASLSALAMLQGAAGQRVPLPPPAMSDDLSWGYMGINSICKGARPCWGSLEVDSMWWWLAGGGVNVVKSCLGRFQCCDKVVASSAFVPIGKAPLGMNEVGPWYPITGLRAKPSPVPQ